MGIPTGGFREDLCRYRECIEKRAGHIPLQHITGEQEFMGFLSG